MNTVVDISSPSAAAPAATVLTMRLTAVSDAAQDIRLFEFSDVAGAILPPAEAGAHVDVHLPDGLVRQYSLVTCDPAPRSYVLGIKLDPASRGGSRYFFEQLAVGQSLTMSAPRNHFPLSAAAAHHVLFAGGIGITPIWAMLQQLRRDGASYELHYSSRARSHMAFRAELESLPGVHLHFDDEQQGRVLDIAGIVKAAPAGSHVYCCGPTPMLEAFQSAAKVLPPEQVHFEYFAAKEERSLEGGYVVELAKSGREFFIPEGKSILDVLREGGLDLDSSCEQGICGICETAVLSGVPDHRDAILSEQERASNKMMMICCSGSKSDRLVLDR